MVQARSESGPAETQPWPRTIQEVGSHGPRATEPSLHTSIQEPEVAQEPASGPWVGSASSIRRNADPQVTGRCATDVTATTEQIDTELN